jgi:RHS repeat-associated protein
LRGCGVRYGFAFNGKERDNETYGEGNAYDFGSRIYDSRLGKMFKPDPFGFAYPGTTPYSGMGGNPITNTDVDGKLIIFVNGFGPTRHGMPQTKLYKNWDVQMSMNIAATLKDDKAIYFNGSSRGVTGALSLLTIKKFGEDPLFTTAAKRFDLGAQAVKGEMAEIIKESLMAQRQSNPNAKINLVGHSMGVAYSAGVIQGLLDATDENGKHLFSESDFGEIWLLAGYQSGDIDKLPNVGEVYVRAHDNDGIAGNKPIPGFEDNFLSTYWKTESKLMEGSDAHGAETFGEYFTKTGNKMPTDVLKPTPKAKTPSSPSKPKSYPKKTPRML